MNQSFKLRYDQMRESNPAGPTEEATPGGQETYSQPGYGRNLCLIWPNGRRMFFNYAYLLTGEFEPNGERNVIKLSFTSHTVQLQGYGLETIFLQLIDQLPRQLEAIDPRYVLEDEPHKNLITDIVVEKRE